MPSINQETGIPGTEPNETLKKSRSDKVLRPNKKQQGKVRHLVIKLLSPFCSMVQITSELLLQIYFGQNMVWKDYTTQRNGKIIKVLDPVIVLNKVSSVAEAAA